MVLKMANAGESIPIMGVISIFSPIEPNGEIREFSAFPFSLQLMFYQTSSKLIVCLMITQNYTQKLYKRASMLQCVLGRFYFS